MMIENTQKIRTNLIRSSLNDRRKKKLIKGSFSLIFSQINSNRITNNKYIDCLRQWCQKSNQSLIDVRAHSRRFIVCLRALILLFDHLKWLKKISSMFVCFCFVFFFFRIYIHTSQVCAIQMEFQQCARARH